MTDPNPRRLPIEESRVYYLLCQLRKCSLTPIETQYQKALQREWNTFMLNPDQMLRFTMPATMLQPLRRLEQILNLQQSAEPVALVIENPKRKYKDPNVAPTRKPHGYWARLAPEIALKYLGGAKVGDLQKEYKTKAQTIYNCLTYYQLQQQKVARHATAPAHAPDPETHSADRGRDPARAEGIHVCAAPARPGISG